MGSHWAGSGTPPSRSKDFYTPLLVVLAQCANDVFGQLFAGLEQISQLRVDGGIFYVLMERHFVVDVHVATKL